MEKCARFCESSQKVERSHKFCKFRSLNVIPSPNYSRLDFIEIKINFSPKVVQLMKELSRKESKPSSGWTNHAFRGINRVWFETCKIWHFYMVPLFAKSVDVVHGMFLTNNALQDEEERTTMRPNKGNLRTIQPMILLHSCETFLLI